MTAYRGQIQTEIELVFNAYGIIHAYAYASGFASSEDRGT
jgi:hypothetical protein